jgi:hypothetical protein
MREKYQNSQQEKIQVLIVPSSQRMKLRKIRAKKGKIS